MSPTISTHGERALIDRLRARLSPDRPFVRVGIGDDAAVLAPERGHLDVVTTDSLVEGVHFRRDWTAAAAIGHKALAVNLSDIAAMGATPRASLLSLVLPADFPLDEFDQLVDGYAQLATRTGTALVGGNMARSPGPVVIDVTVMGCVRERRLLRRSGAAAGDELFVTGALGAAAAGLAWLNEGIDRATAASEALECIERQERPEPRLRFAGIVARTSAAVAAIDLSDGLADAGTRLADAAGLALVVQAGDIPVHAGARARAGRLGMSAAMFALAAGEDYELAFAVPARRRRRFLAAAHRCPDLLVTRIGRFETGHGAWLEDEGVRTPFPAGFGHF
jgi:thiamine-monophosphate kinase